MYYAEVEIREGNTTVVHTLHDPHTSDTVLYRGKATFMLNAINDFRFELLPSHPLYETEIPAYLSWIRIKDTQGEIIFRGRVIDLSRRMSAIGTPIKAYIAECELAYLLDSVQRVRVFRGIRAVTTGEFLRRLIMRHNERVELEKRFQSVEVNGEVYDPALPEDPPEPEEPEYPESPEEPEYPEDDEDAAAPTAHYIHYASSFENIKENLLERFGGYIWIEYRIDAGEMQRVLCYHQDQDEDDNGDAEPDEAEQGGKSFWKDSEMPIRLAENLESIRSERLSSRAVTRIVPLGIALNTPENAIRRLVAVGIINNDDIEDARDYGQNVEWWKHNYNRIDPWMFQLLLNFSRLNFMKCHGERSGCDHEACNPEDDDIPEALFDDANARLDDVSNVRNSEEFSRAVHSLAREGVAIGTMFRPLRAIINPGYWIQRGRGNMPSAQIQNIADDDERIFLMRLRWLIRKVERYMTKCRPRLHQVDELDSRLNIGNPTWIDVDMELALRRLEDAGIILTKEHWMRHFNSRFQLTISPWTAQLLIALSALNYDPSRVAEARTAIYGPSAAEAMRTYRQAELFAGIDALHTAGAINSPEYWKDITENAIDIASLLWMTGQSIHTANPRSHLANSARNLFGTTVEKVIIFDDVADCDELWTRGITWIRNRVLSSSISISALDLSQLDLSYERFKVGYTYRAENHLLGINERYPLIQQTIDIVNPLKSNLTFGDRQIALSSDSSRAR